MHDSCDSNGAQQLLPWSECNVFCIHSYAGAATACCGWRGKLFEPQLADARSMPLCPRCGRATLLPIHLDRGNEPHA